MTEFADPEILQEFVLESVQSLRGIEQDILKIETEGASQALIDRIFRAIHSIKGTSGYLNFRNIVAVSHLGETLLDYLRKGTAQINAGIVDVILAAIDGLVSMIESPDYGESYDARELSSRLQNVIDEVLRSSSGTSAPSPPVAGPWTRDDVSAAMQKASGLDDVFALVIADPAPLRRQPIFASGIVSGLSSVGKILHATIPLSQIDQASSNCTVFLQTILDKELIAGAFGLPPENIHLVSTPSVGQAGAYPSIAPSAKPVVAEAATAPVSKSVVAEAPKPAAPVAKPALATAPTSKPIHETTPAKPVMRPSESPSEKPLAKGQSSGEAQMMRVNTKFLDDLLRLTGNMVMARNQLLSRYQFSGDNAFATLSRCITEVHQNVVQTRMQSVGVLFDRFTRVIRDLGRQLNKEIELHISGRDIELDRTILETFADPLTHMIRNSVDHGIELPEERMRVGKTRVGNIYLRAYHESGEIIIQVEDDGKGIDAQRVKAKAVERRMISEDEAARMSDHEAIQLIFAAGFSTKDEASDLSGRGVGMDVVKTNIEKIGGAVDIETTVGLGAKFSARLPLTQALVSSSLISALLIAIGEHRFAIPETAVNEIIKINPQFEGDRIRALENRDVYQLRDMVLPIVHLEDVLQISRTYIDKEGRVQTDKRQNIGDRRLNPSPLAPSAENRLHSDRRRTKQILVVLQFRQSLFGILVDRVIGIEEIVVRSSPLLVKNSTVFSGHTVLGDGAVIMILDINGMVENRKLDFTDKRRSIAQRRDESGRDGGVAKQKMVIFNYADDERFAIPLEMVSLIEKISVQSIKRVGKKEYFQFKQRTIPLMRLDHHIDVNPVSPSLTHYHLIMPARVSYPIGLLTGREITFVDVAEDFDTRIDDGKGIVGTFMNDDRLVMLLDLYTLFERHSPDRYASANGDTGSMSILVVEDSMFFRKLIVQYLTQKNRRIVLAGDGREAIAALNAEPEGFDLIVSDIEMPNMNGFEFVRHVKTDPRFAEIPCLALTSLADQQNVERGMRAGFDEYVIKIDKETLVKTIHHWLSKSKRPRVKIAAEDE